MIVGRIEGNVVATVKDRRLTGVKLLLVRLIENGTPKNLIVAADITRQAGMNDFVTLETSKESSLMFREEQCACDYGITGFIDDFHEEL